MCGPSSGQSERDSGSPPAIATHHDKPGKQERLRQAKAEAEKEIAAYKAEREGAYQKKLAEVCIVLCALALTVVDLDRALLRVALAASAGAGEPRARERRTVAAAAAKASYECPSLSHAPHTTPQPNQNTTKKQSSTGSAATTERMSGEAEASVKQVYADVAAKKQQVRRGVEGVVAVVVLWCAVVCPCVVGRRGEGQASRQQRQQSSAAAKGRPEKLQRRAAPPPPSLDPFLLFPVYKLNPSTALAFRCFGDATHLHGLREQHAGGKKKGVWDAAARAPPRQTRATHSCPIETHHAQTTAHTQPPSPSLPLSLCAPPQLRPAWALFLPPIRSSTCWSSTSRRCSCEEEEGG